MSPKNLNVEVGAALTKVLAFFSDASPNSFRYLLFAASCFAKYVGLGLDDLLRLSIMGFEIQHTHNIKLSSH